MLNLTQQLLKDEQHRKIMLDVKHFVTIIYAYKNDNDDVDDKEDLFNCDYIIS